MMVYKSCINNFVYEGRSNRCDAYMAPVKEIEKGKWIKRKWKLLVNELSKKIFQIGHANTMVSPAFSAKKRAFIFLSAIYKWTHH